MIKYKHLYHLPVKETKMFKMTGISRTKCLLMLVFCLLWMGNASLFAQTTDNITICDAWNNTYRFTSGTVRTGTWKTVQGYAVLSDPTRHDDCTFSNISFGVNIFEFWQVANTNPNPEPTDWREHLLRIYNTKVEAGRDTTLCSYVTTYTLNGSNPAEFTGCTGTWTISPATATITNTHAYNTTITGLVPGTVYTLTWTLTGLPTDNNTNGPNCFSITDNDAVKITVLATPPNANLGADLSICPGNSATITAPLNTFYSWSNGATTQSITVNPLVSSNYAVTVKDANNCTATDDINVIVNNITAYDVSQNATAYCSGSPGVNISLSNSDLGVSYQLKNFGVDVDPPKAGTGGVLTWTNKSTGSYTIVGTKNGCSKTMNGTMTVTMVNTPSNFTLTSSSPSYCAGSGVTLTLNGSQSGAAYTYSLLQNGVAISTVNGSGAALIWPNISAGTYSVQAKVSAAVTCTATMSGSPVITENPLPVANAGVDKTICQGNSVQLSASGGAGYSWSPAAGLNNTNINNPVASPASTTVYTVTVTDGNGCSSSDQVQVTVNAKPIPSISPNTAICSGNSAVLSATGGTGYTWSTGETTSDISVSPSTTTTYSVTVNNAIGCTATASTTVTVNPIPTVTFTGLPASICKNGTPATITGNHAPSGSFTGLGITDLGNGTATFSPASLVANNTYTITYNYKDPATTCSNSKSFSITVKPIPTAHSVSGGGSYCAGGAGQSVTISSPDAGINYELFLNGVTTGIIKTNGTLPFTGLTQAGTYTIKGTDPVNSCSVSMLGNAVVTVDPMPDDAQNITGPNSICAGSTQSYSVPAILNSDTYTWQLPPNTTITSGAGTNSITVYYGTTATSGNVVVQGTNACGSGAASVYAVTVKPLPAAAGVITGLNKVCQGESNVIYQVPNIAGATGYIWTVPSGATITSGQGTTMINVNFGTATSGNIIVKGTNACGSGTMSSFAVNVVPKPTLSLDQNPSKVNCTGATVTLSATSSTNNLTWQALNGGHIVSVADPRHPTVDAAGDYVVTATEPVNSCTATDQVTVFSDLTPPQGITINASNGGKIDCTIKQITLTANTTTVAPISYSWVASAGGHISAGANQAVATADQQGVYTVTVTNLSNGCYATQSYTVTQQIVNPNISVVNPATDKLTCKQTSIQLAGGSSTSGATFSWTGPGVVSNGNTDKPTVNKTGIYTLTVTAPNGCTSSAIVQVTDDLTKPAVMVYVPEDSINCINSQVMIKGTSTTAGATLKWKGPGAISDPAIETPMVDQPGNYYLVVTHPITGCRDSALLKVIKDITVPQILVNNSPAPLTCTTPTTTLNGSSTTPSVTFQWTGPAGATITGGTTASPIVDKIGNYTLTITGVNGCKSTGTTTVTQTVNPPAKPNIISDVLSCTKTTVQLTVSPLVANVSYLWTTTGTGTIINPNTSVATVDQTGTYTVEVTDLTTGCKNQSSVVVTRDNSNPSPQITGGPYQVSCTKPTVILDGSTSTGINPVWTASLGGHIASGGNTFLPTVDAAGTYTLTLTNAASGCTQSVDVSVSVASDLPGIAIDDNPAKITCTNKTVTLSGKPTEAGTSFSWSASPGNIQSGGNSYNPVVDKAGTYLITVKNANNCTNTAAIYVQEDIAPPQLVVATPGQFTCTQKEVQLKATSPNPNVSYAWVPQGSGLIKPGYENVSNPIVQEPADYKVTLTNLDNGCTATGTITVGVNTTTPLISVNKTPAKLTCSVNQVQVSGNSLTSGATYLWSTVSAGNISNPTLKNPMVDAIGYYKLTIKDPSNGCTISDSVQVTDDKAKPNIWVDTNPPVLGCTNTQVKLSGNSSTANVTFSWSGPAGASISDPTIKEPLVNLPGQYILTVKALNGCTSSLPVTVVQNTTKPAPPLASDGNACFGAPAGVLTATGTTIKWYSNASLTLTSKLHDGDTFTPSGYNAVGSYQFFATQTNASTGCESNPKTVTYTVIAPPAAPASVSQSVCQGLPTPQLQATGTSIKWYDAPGGNFLGNGNNYTPIVSASGTYTYYATQTDANNCESTPAGVILTINPVPAKPTVNTLNASVCAGGTNPAFVAAGTTLKWYSDASLTVPVGVGTTYTPTQSAVGTYNYYVTQTSAQGCVSVYETVTLIIKPLPQVFNITGGGTYCSNLNGIAVGTDGSETTAIYKLYYNTSTLVNTLTGTGSALDFGLQKLAGNYTVLAEGTNGCTATMAGSRPVVISPIPDAAGSIVGQATVCQGITGISYTLSPVANATSYQWTVPAGATITNGQGTNTITVSYGVSAIPGTVTVRGVNACGQGPQSSLNVNVVALPTVSTNLNGGTLTCTVPELTLTATSSNVTYLWTATNGGHFSTGADPAQQSVKVDTKGDYIITVTEPVNACKASATVHVIEAKDAPQDVAINATNAGVINCSVSKITLTASTSSSFSVNYAWATSAGGHIDSGSGSSTPVVDKAGTYTVTVTNTTSGCQAIASINITEDKTVPLIAMNKTPLALNCKNTTVQLSGSATGCTLLWTGPAGATFTGGATSPTPLIDKPGKYTLTATAANGCTASDFTNVTINTTVPNVSITPPAILTCSVKTVDLTGNSTTSGVTYTWAASNGGNIVSANNIQIITVDKPGKYVATVTDAVNFCQAKDSVIVTNDLSTPVITFPATPPAISCSQPTTVINSTVTPANSTILWTGPGTISNTAVTNPTVNAAGIFTLTATHPVTGCITSGTITVNDGRTSPVVTIAVPETITCAKPTITLAGTTNVTNYTAKWTTSDGTISGSDANLNVNVTAKGTYTLTVKDNTSGCITTKSVLVVDDITNPLVTVDQNPAPITCSVKQTELYGYSTTTGVNLLWSGPVGSNITDPLAERPKVDMPGIYTLKVTAPNGCTATGSVTVSQNKTIPNAPVIKTPADLTCSTTSVTLEADPLVNVDYLWTTTGAGHISSATSLSTSVDNIGIYTLKVTDRTSGCTNQSSVTVNKKSTVPLPAIAGGPYIITCSNKTLELDGSTSTGINPVWTATLGGRIVSGGNTFKPTVDAAGTYTITTADATTGCTNSASVVVTASTDVPGITFNATPDKITCAKSSVLLSGQPADAGNSYTWSTNPGHIVAGTETSFTPKVDQPGNYTITVKNPSTNCTNTATIVVVEDKSAPVVSITTPDNITCSRKEVPITASTTIANPSYKWTTSGTGSIKGGFDNVAGTIVLSKGTYNLVVTDLDNGCSTAKTVDVTENKTAPVINVNKNTDTITCARKEVSLSANVIAGATYLWSTSGTGNIINPTTPNPRVDGPGTYTLTITDGVNGCPATDFVKVEQDLTKPAIWVEPNPAILTCKVTSVVIKGSSTTPYATYNWNGNGFSSTLKEPSVTNPGIYTLTVTGRNGCTISANVTVNQQNAVPSAPMVNNASACYGSPAATLTATGNNIKWYTNASLDPATKIQDGSSFTPTSVTAAGSYSYFVTQTDPVSLCESAATEATYTVLALPAAPVNTDKAVCFGNANPALQASGSNIRWYSAPAGSLLGTGGQYTPPPSVSAVSVYTYYATQTDNNGCQSTTTPVKLTINAVPSKPVLSTLTTTICEGASNPVITASGTAVNWYDNTTAVIATGTSFTPPVVAAGSYTYRATQTINGCTSPYETLSFTISPLPKTFSVTGGGTYCENLAGLTIGLSGSEVGTNYQLLLNGSNLAGTAAGTGSAFDFGLQKASGIYTVKATGPAGCQMDMNGSANISASPLPLAAGVITGTAKICQGTTNQIYTISPVTNATSYEWAVPPGATIVNGQGTNTITVNYGTSASSGVITVKGINSCGSGTANSLTINVVSKPQMTLNTSPGTLSCDVPKLTLSASSTTPGVVYSWQALNGGNILSGDNTEKPEVNSKGDYVVTITEPDNGCQTKGTITVPADMSTPQNVQITSTNSGVVTCSVSEVILSATTSSTFPVSYKWTASSGGNIKSGINNADAVVDKAGVYDVLVTNLNTGCTSFQSFTVSNQKTVPQVSVVDPAIDKLSCTNTTVTLSASSTTPDVTYKWTGPSLIVNDNTATPTVSKDGVYTLTVTSKDGCETTKTVNVQPEYSAPTVSVNSTPDVITCSKPTVSLQGSSTTTGALLKWTGLGIVSGDNLETPVVNQPGTYVLTVTHPLSGCKASAQVVVSRDINNPAITFPVIPATLTCTTPQTSLKANTSAVNANYLWTTVNGTIVSGETTASPVVSKAGTYNIKVTNTDNGCVSNASLIVSADQNTPDAQIDAPGEISCTKPSVTLNGSSVTTPVTVNWTTSNGAISAGATSFTPTVTKGGTYSMTVTNTTTGCKAVANVTVPENTAKPAISIDKSPATISCGQPTVQLNGTAPGSTLLWTGPSGAVIDNATSPTPTVNKPGRYYLTATGANGCISKDSTEVPGNTAKPTNVTINAPGVLTCTNPTIQLSGSSSTTNALFAWSAISGGNILSSPVSDIITIDAPGTYKLVVSHPSSLCKDSATVTVSQNKTVPSVSFPDVPVAITCASATSTLNSQVVPSNSAIVWSGPGTISNTSIANPVVNAAGIYTITATHPVSGCKTVKTITVPENKVTPVISIAAPETISCSKTSIILKGTINITDYKAKWTTTDGAITLPDDLKDVTVTKGGTYTLTITDNTNGCQSFKSVFVTEDTGKPDLTVNKNPAKLTCTVTEVELFANSTAPVTYSWSGGSITGLNVPKPKVTTAGNYTVTVTAANGCTSSDVITVAEDKTTPAIPNILSPDPLTCTKLTTDLQISPVLTDVDYVWSTTGSGKITNGNSAIATVNAIGTYKIVVTNRTSGCTNENSMTVSELKTVPTVAINGSSYVLSCATPTLQLDGASNGINPVWSATDGGHISADGNTLKPTIDAAGTYTLTTTNATTGCTSSASIVVTSTSDLPKLTVDPYPATLTCSVKSVRINGQPTETGTTFTWTASPGNIVSDGDKYNPLVDKPGTYILTVTKTATGCKSTAAIEVKENITPPQVSIDAHETFSCKIKQVQLNASSNSASVSYAWSTNATTEPADKSIANPIALAKGTYTVTVTDLANNCSTTASTLVSEQIDAPLINVDKDPAKVILTCTTKQVQLSGSSLTSGVTYQWTTKTGGSIVGSNNTNPYVDATGYYVLTVLNPATGCTSKDSVQVTKDITVPAIWVDTKPDTLNCAASTIVVKGNSSSSNVTYSWNGPGIVANGASKEATVNAPGTYILTVTSVSNGCTSSRPVEVMDNKTVPAAPVVINAKACLGAPATALTAVGYDIKWYSDPSLAPSALIHTGNSFTPASAITVGNHYYYATQSDPQSHCVSLAAEATYTVLALPAGPVNINNSVCEGFPNPPIQATGSSIKWYDAPGGTLLGSGTNFVPPASVSLPGTYTYFATQTDANGCESATTNVSLTIHSNPSKPLLDKLTADVCKGQSNPSFTASGMNIKWYASPTLPAPVKTGNSYTSLESNTGTYNYYVTQTNSYGCVSPYETVTLRINDLPQKYTVTGGGVYCADLNGLPVGLSGSDNNVSYQLLLNGTTVITTLSGTGAALDFGIQKTTGDYTVVATSGSSCTVAMNGGVTISTSQLPAAAGTVTGLTAVCQQTSSITYKVDPIANATSYTWSVPAGATISAGLNSNTIVVDYSGSAASGPIHVIGTNACGSGLVSPDLLVVVAPMPAAAGSIKFAGGNNAVCLGSEGIVYEVDPIANATDYEWVLPAGASIQYGANTRSVRLKFAPNAATGTQVIKVRGKNSCGNGVWSTPYTITVNSNPAVYAGIDQNLCAGSTVLQGSAIPAGGTGNWTLVKGSVTIENAALNNSGISSVSQGENVLTWTVTANGCTSVDTVKIINNQLNVDAGQNLPICASTITLSGSALPAGTTGNWTIATGNATFTAASQPNTKASNFGYGDNKLYWTVTRNGCKSRDSVIITNYHPTIPDAGGDKYICFDRTTISANTPVYGTGQWTVYSGSATFSDPNSPTTNITSVGKGQNKLVWTITNQICSMSDTMIVTNNALDVNAGYDQTVCENRTTMDATVPPTGSTGQWSVLQGSASFLDSKSPTTKISGLVTGTNKLIWSLLRGSCVNTDTVTIISNEPTTPNAGSDQFLSGNSTIMTGNQPIIGTGQWSIISGAGTFADKSLYNSTVTNLNPGTNILRWTITYNGCSAYDDVVLTNGTIEQVEAGQDQVLCTNETKLEASKPQYGFGVWTVQRGAANFEDNETFNTKVTNLAPGRNVLRWTVIISGIEFYDTVTIVNNKPTVAMVGPSQVLCGDSSMLTGNLPIYGTGKWTLDGGAGIISNINKNNPKVTKLATGDNLFRWTITNGTCESYATLKITNDTPTQADAGLDETICEDKTTLLPNAPIIGTGEWSVVAGSGKFTGNDVSGLAQGKNTLRWTIHQNNCSSSDDVNIISYKPTPANAGFNTVVCVDSLFLSANKVNTFLGESGKWKVMNGAGIITDSALNTSLVKRLAPGKNVLRWTITNHGCISSADVEVNYAFIKSIAGTDIVTCDDHVILNANNPGIGTGEWSVVGGSGTAVFVSPSSPNTEVQNLDKGKNILRWTIRNYTCVSNSEVSITNNSPSEAFAGGDDAVCSSTTNLDAKPPLIGTGAWSVLSGSGRFIDTVAYNTKVTNVGSGANTYRWTVTNANCVSTDEVVISNNSPINTNAGVNQTICSDSTMLAARQPLIGTGIWSIIKGAGMFKDATNPYSKIYKLAPDTNVLRWTITNKNCVDYREIKVVNNLPTQATAGANMTICSDYVMLDGNNPVTGLGEWSVISGSGKFTDKNRYNSLVQGLTRGTNVLRWKISKQGCSTYADVTIKDDLPTQPDAGTNIAVCDNFTPLNANKPAIGKGYWSVVSGKGTFLDSTVYNTTILGLGQGSNILKWTVTNNRCTIFDVVEVKNNQTNVYAGPDQMVFENHSLLVGNEPTRGLGTWKLEAGTGTIPDPNNYEAAVTGLSEGANTFTWSVNIDGCISTDRVIVNYYIYPTASFAVSNTDGCPPFKVNFTKTTVEKYPFKWVFGLSDSTSVKENPSFTYPAPGTYTAKLIVTAPDGKEVSKQKTITVHELPKVNFEIVPAEVYIPGQSLRCYNYSDKGNNYVWDFGDGETSQDFNPEHTYRDSGLYAIKLVVSTANQCKDSLIIHNGVHVMEKSRIKFPTAFTPNLNGSSNGQYNKNDFSNDVFYPIVLMGDLREYHLEIYNRWGVLLFKSDDINVGWDGYYQGRLLMQDVYIYRCSGIYNDGKRFSLIGDVLLMRR